MKEYNREYYKRHKEKIQKLRSQNKEKMSDYLRDYRIEKKEKIQENKRNYYRQNREKMKENVRIYRAVNKEKIDSKNNSPGCSPRERRDMKEFFSEVLYVKRFLSYIYNNQIIEEKN